MKTQHLSKAYVAKIQIVSEALTATREGMTRAGKTIVEMLNEVPETFEILLGQVKGLTLPFLETLEQIGLGKLDPLLLTDTCPAAQRAVSQGLSPKDQERLISGSVPVVTRINGGVRTENLKMGEMTELQSRLVIGPTLRTPDEQIEILKAQESSRAARSLRYEIRDGKIKFHQDTEFDHGEILEVAAKIAPRAKDIEAEIKRNQIT